MSMIIDLSPVKSIQTGYVDTTSLAGVGEDGTYIDAPISPVNTAKCVVSGWAGGIDSVSGLCRARLINSTTLRISATKPTNVYAYLRWQILEYK